MNVLRRRTGRILGSQKRLASGAHPERWDKNLYRYKFYDPPIHDKFNMRGEPMWIARLLGAFTLWFWGTTFYDKFAHSMPLACQEFASAQINAIYDVSKCTAPYKREDLDWDYGIILTETHAAS